MYYFTLFLHSWLRWVLLLLLLVVIFRSFYGWFGNKEYQKSDNISSITLVSLFHIQLVIGLILYLFLSPLTKTAFQDFGSAMKDSQLRYWAVEHIFIMILSIISAQIGRIKIKKSHADKNKFKNSAIYFLLALILILTRIPWQEYNRLIRSF